jgi:glycosyltransferase involved in cell wall biosynthesis
MAQRMYRGAMVMTVADLFIDIYRERHAWLKVAASLIRRMDARAWRQCRHLFVKTSAARDWLVKQGVEPDRISVVYNPCDTSFYRPGDRHRARESLGLPQQATILVHHGVLHPNKGNDLLIRAWSDVLAVDSSALLVLVGAGPESTRLQRLVEELKVSSHVLFMGWLPTERDVVTVLQAADVGLVVRIGQESDDFHVTDTLTHCMACGLPILAADMAGTREFVTPKIGVRFTPRDSTDFVRAFRDLVAVREEWPQMGGAARQKAEREFDTETYADRVVNGLLAAAPPRSREDETKRSLTDTRR